VREIWWHTQGGKDTSLSEWDRQMAEEVCISMKTRNRNQQEKRGGTVVGPKGIRVDQGKIDKEKTIAIAKGGWNKKAEAKKKATDRRAFKERAEEIKMG